LLFVPFEKLDPPRNTHARVRYVEPGSDFHKLRAGSDQVASLP